MKNLLIVLAIFCATTTPGYCQNVGIGTISPHPKALLDLTSTNQVFLAPRLDANQIESMGTPPTGAWLFNTSLSSPMVYARMGWRRNLINPTSFFANFRWLPVSPGPKVLAWGIVDSAIANENSSPPTVCNVRNGSGNFVITYHSKVDAKNYYELKLLNDNFRADSMMLMITPIGGLPADVAPHVFELQSGSDWIAIIHFQDISRHVAGWNNLDRRRQSRFSFVLYDLRGY